MSTMSLNAAKLLEGRLALITGAGQGNGRALAIGLAAAGARVVVTDVNPATAAETARLVRDQGGTAFAETLDVTSSEACKALAARVARKAGARSTCWSTTPASSFARAATAPEPRPTGGSRWT
jgi:NAD(P)-dependent dehydrogenase (short-subunit alcohol dehydrogenase family)